MTKYDYPDKPPRCKDCGAKLRKVKGYYRERCWACKEKRDKERKKGTWI